MTLLRTPMRREAAPCKGFLRTRRPKHRHVPWRPSWMGAEWYTERNALRDRFEALRSGEYSQGRVLNENWMTPHAWYTQKNELRERFAEQFLDD